MQRLIKFLNPLALLQAIFTMIATVFRGILAGLGFGQLPVLPSQHESLASDIEDAARLAAEQEAAVNALQRHRTPGDVVHAYAKAESGERSTINLAALDEIQQDWLMCLSDADLVLLAGSGPDACARSLEKLKVLPDFRKLRARPEMKSAPPILAVPFMADSENARRQHVRMQYDLLRRSLTEPQMKPTFY